MNPLARRALIGAGIGGLGGVAAGGMTGPSEGRGKRMLGYGLGGAALGAGAGAASGMVKRPVPAAMTPGVAGASTVPAQMAAPAASVARPAASTMTPLDGATRVSRPAAPVDNATRVSRPGAAAGGRPATPAPKARTSPDQLRDAILQYSQVAPGSVDADHIQAWLGNADFLRKGSDLATRQLSR